MFEVAFQKDLHHVHLSSIDIVQFAHQPRFALRTCKQWLQELKVL